jgi:hypothetical protein
VYYLGFGATSGVIGEKMAAAAAAPGVRVTDDSDDDGSGRVAPGGEPMAVVLHCIAQ